MSVALRTQGPGSADPDRLTARVGPVGRALSDALRRLLDALPGAPHRPSQLARQLGLSRVTLGRVRNAIACTSPTEVLEQVPGPESLRALARAAANVGVAPACVAAAHAAIDAFAELIRRDFGTRGAFNAAITPERPASKRRFEHASRYQVYMGMRQILGVEADTWLTCMLFTPAPDSDEYLSVTTLHGAVGMRRLRPDVHVYFTFGPPAQVACGARDVSRSAIDLREFYAHTPAPLETHEAGGQLVHRLAHDRIGRQATVDMLAVGHHAHGSRRYATPERPRAGVVVFPDVPVKLLVCDALVHADVFPSAQPELIVYNPGSRGPTNPTDARRDIDRVPVPEQIEARGAVVDDSFDVDEIPNYRAMVAHVCRHIGHDPTRFRVFRLRMVYPIYNFQVVLAFDPPRRP